MQTRRRRRAAAAQEAPAGGGGPSATLLSLPLDAIEAIAGPLPLADRRVLKLVLASHVQGILGIRHAGSLIIPFTP